MPRSMAAFIFQVRAWLASRVPTPVLATRVISALSEFTRPLSRGIIAQ